jgi:hypothetical protein
VTSRARALAAAHAAASDPRDAEAAARRAEMASLRAANALATPHDQAAAAFVLLDGDDAGQVEAAHALALQAMARLPAARPLAAAAYDRLRVLAGRPQKFGTQWIVRDGVAALAPCDPATTDSERAKWGLPPFADLQRRAWRWDHGNL